MAASAIVPGLPCPIDQSQSAVPISVAGKSPPRIARPVRKTQTARPKASAASR